MRLMKNSAQAFFFLITLLSIKSFSCFADQKQSLVFGSFVVTKDKIIEISLKAIDKCFYNVKNGIVSQNFPDSPGPSNLEFPIGKEFEYDTIIGYEFIESDPRILKTV